MINKILNKIWVGNKRAMGLTSTPFSELAHKFYYFVISPLLIHKSNTSVYYEKFDSKLLFRRPYALIFQSSNRNILNIFLLMITVL